MSNFSCSLTELLHHTVWRTWLFTAYWDEQCLYYQFSLPHLYISLQKGWENVLFLTVYTYDRHRGNTLFFRTVTSILSQRLLHKMANPRLVFIASSAVALTQISAYVTHKNQAVRKIMEAAMRTAYVQNVTRFPHVSIR